MTSLPRPLHWLLLAFTFTLTATPIPAAAQTTPNLVQNGDFELGVGDKDLPTAWQTSGRADIEQSLVLDTGRSGGHSARLNCQRFVGGTPDAHVMMCQLGVVGIDRGKWYRLSFWVRGENLSKPVGSVAVSNTRPWGSSGVDGQFVAGKNWRPIELFCQASDSVPAETSRLQFWFSGTGTMWFDDMVLQTVDMTEAFHPAIATEGITNLIPNSSFECGSAQWGNYSPKISTWAGNINQQLGTIDDSTAQHGRQSLRIDVDKSSAPVFYWDYYEPIVEPIRTVVCANEGWVPVQAGKSYALSCYLKSDQPGVPALLLVHNAQRGSNVKAFKVDQQWTRYEFVFRPRSEYIWIGAGIDLAESSIQTARLWIDAVQLELGDGTSHYATRSPIESTVTTPAVGNIFTIPEGGLSVDLHLVNAADTAKTVTGRITATDFFDREVLRREVTLDVAAHSSHVEHLTQLLAGELGFYRVSWSPTDHQPPFLQTLRCALLQPYSHHDSPFGMNHAYPWDFMLGLCRQGGLTWMRDWSAKWNTVEPQQGAWDFSQVDPQIDRILRMDLNPLVLLPFASAAWCSSADLDLLKRQVGDDKGNLNRSIVACPANDPALFRNYVEKTVQRYRSRTRWVEIMNEPLYTSYAVPAAYGYKLDDYLQILRHAHETIKTTSPETQVIGGIGAWVDSHWVQDFIDAGGLQWCDAMDIHLYPVTIPPESYEEELAKTWQKMRSRGEAKPIWLTEFGCYADDDPYKTPGQIGDSTMSRANWGSEQGAAEALVKTAAVFLSHGVRKIFYHAGTCGPMNSSSGGGIFFEYGGAPRKKMFAAQSALANQLGPNPAARIVSSQVEHLHRYLFDTQQGFVAIVWAAADQRVTLSLPPNVTAFDLMGRPLPGTTLQVSSTPLYLRSSRLEDLGG